VFLGLFSALKIGSVITQVDLTAYVEKHDFTFDAVLDEQVSNDEVLKISSHESSSCETSFSTISHFLRLAGVQSYGRANYTYYFSTY
jgi:hypothetical protein